MATAATMASAAKETYTRRTVLEQIREVPETWTGPTDLRECETYVNADAAANATVRFERREVKYVPALMKLLDEVVVNALDAAVRSGAVRTIDIAVDRESGRITVSNDCEGQGIPVAPHETECDEEGRPLLVPTLIFFHLFTSSNYRKHDDDTRLVTGGKNGVGVKLAAAFSVEFTAEVVDAVLGKHFTQTCRDGLSVIDPPTVRAIRRKAGSVSVSFVPDYARFGQEGMTEDMFRMVERRALDAAAWSGTGVSVKFNGRKLQEARHVEAYADLFLGRRGDPERLPRVYFSPHPRWHVVVAPSRSPADGFRQVSMVNGVCTTQGGSHVDYVVKQVVDAYVAAAEKKFRGLTIRPSHVREQLFVIVFATIDNPSFESQSKERLTSHVRNFGSRPTVSEEVHQKIFRTLGIAERVASVAAAQEDKDAKKSDGKKRTRVSVPGLEDAHDAGTARSDQCKLIITEGNSAKATAIAGVSALKDGRRRFGIYPIRGKFMNCLDASLAKQNQNEEVNALKKALGLEHGKEYTSVRELRYGQVVIMADADHDGSHIRALLTTFFWSRWPSLMRVERPFIASLMSPIIRATHKRTRASREFYTLGEYHAWEHESGPSGVDQHTVKYYKGLGTHSRQEAQEIMRRDMTMQYVFDEGADDALDMAFRKSRATDRKQWLRGIDHNAALAFDRERPEVSVRDVVHKELIFYVERSVERVVPSVVDGLKESIRKILFACFKRNLTRHEIKVAQLAANVSEVSGYRHGEASLISAIIGMAQRFKNNVPLLEDRGQFGTRLMGGDDAAAPRYIYTLLRDYVNLIFRPDDRDAAVLPHLTEDGESIEPAYYHPVLPIAAIAGDIGVGTAYSTEIPPHNPEDIATLVLRLLDAPEVRAIPDDAGASPDAARAAARAATAADAIPLEEPVPWIAGFRGTIRPAGVAGRHAFESVGVLVPGARGTWEVTELPVGTWTDTYRAFLDGLVEAGKLRSFVNESTDEAVRFVLTPAPGFSPTVESLKLVSRDRLSCTNMHLFNADRVITKYEAITDIVRDYFPERLAQYVRRKQHLVSAAEREIERVAAKHRYVSEVVSGELSIVRRSAADICADLADRGYPPLDGPRFAYLRGMPTDALDDDSREALGRKLERLRADLVALRETHVTETWRAEIGEFMDSWRAYHAAHYARA